MSRTEIVVLTLRLSAAYLLEKAFWYVPGMVSVWSVAESPSFPYGRTIYTLTTALYVICGLAIFAAAPAIAQRARAAPSPANVADRSQIGGLALRIAAIVVLNHALEAGASAGQMLAVSPNPMFYGAVASLCIAVAFAGVGTWFFVRGPELAPRIFRLGPADDVPHLAHLQAAAFAVVGVWILSDTLPDLVSMASASFDGLAPYGRADFVAAIVRCALGIVLFVGSGALARGWRWIRTAGLTPRVTHAGDA